MLYQVPNSVPVIEADAVLRLANCGLGLTFPTLFAAQVCSTEHLAQHCPHIPNVGSGAVRGVNFAVYERQEKHLRIIHGGAVDFEGGRGPWATFEATLSDGVSVSLRCLGPHQRAHFLSSQRLADGSMQLASSLNPHEPCSRWCFVPARLSEAVKPFDENVVLSAEDLEFFAREGYLICRNAVSGKQVDAALRVVNNLIGKGPSAWVEDPHQPQPTDGSPPKMILPHSNHKAIVALAEQSYVKTIAQRILGRGNVKQVWGGQLAIRFPVADVFEEVDGVLSGPAKQLADRNASTRDFHIDGQGREHAFPFSLLCLVALSDQGYTGCGNFTVFPRSHRNKELIRWYHAARHGGDELVRQLHDARPNLGDPLQVCLEPTDCVFVHPLLAHRVGTNVSPHVRYSIIFRLHHPNFEADAKECEPIEANPLFIYPPCAAMRFFDD